ncbi:MAG: DNA ligase D [Solirubrobacteraceae bacterium]
MLVLTGAGAKHSGTGMPESIAPMLARLTTLPKDESRWAFEVKWDGARALAHSRPGDLCFRSRAGNDVSEAYPELQRLNPALGSHAAVLDGEIVAFDARGVPSFQALQSRMHVRKRAAVRRLAETTPVTYMIFDLLWLDGISLLELPYRERRARLDALALEGVSFRVPEYHRGRGRDLLQATREHGIEGVVGKLLDSPYRAGRRSPAWVKVKNSMRQELVIGGWTLGKGSRADDLGALLLGVHAQHGELRYAGKVGTGFGLEERRRLAGLLEPLARTTSPFTGRQPPRGARFVDPELVCEVEFSEWTRAGTLRAPAYRGLRDDKAAVAVVRERAQVVQGSAAEVARASGRAKKGDLEAVIEAGYSASGGIEIQLDGRTLKLSNLDKVLYPSSGLRKRDVICYYAAMAPVLLGHLRDRPLTLKRYPDGVEGKFFYEKRSPVHRPAWVQTVEVPSERTGRPIGYTLCQDLPTLVWLANLANLELHPLLSRTSAMDRPTAVAFDLDPGTPAGIAECCEVALRLRELLASLGLRAFPKTSGSKGLQVYVPLNTGLSDFTATKRFAHAVALLLEERHPELIVSAMNRTRRTGKVLIDWSQNDEHKTTVAVYSLRATEHPLVSTPVDWSEVSAIADRGERLDSDALSFTPAAALARAELEGDRFREVLSLPQRLPELGE